MHAQVDSKKLKSALDFLVALPGFDDHTILISTKDDGLYFEGAGDGSFAAVSIPANIMASGSLAVDADYMRNLRLQKETVIQKQGSRLTFSSGRLKGDIVLTEDSVSQHRPSKEIDCVVQLNRELFLAAIKQTAFAPSLPDPSFGLRLILEGRICKFICNDTYRAILYFQDLPQWVEKKLDIVISPDVLKHICSKATGDHISIGVRDGIVRTKADNLDVTFPAIQAQADDVEAFLQEVSETDSLGSVEVNTSEFLDTCRAASSLVKGLGFEVQLTLAFKGKTVQIDVESPHGNAQAEYGLETEVKKDFHVLLNSKYLIDLLKMVQEDTFNLQVWEALIILSADDNRYQSSLSTLSVE